MEKLDTIQKRERLNDVCTVGERGPGDAYHQYEISRGGKPVATIQFQEGPRSSPKATTGVLDVDLLEIARDRLRSFQKGPYSCRENAVALTHIEEALLWLNKRVEDRISRGVLGTEAK